MKEIEQFETPYRQNKSIALLTEQLMEYQTVKTKADALKAHLEELNSAIEDFDLACAKNLVNDQRVIYCRAQSYTPLALVQQAGQVANALEACAAELEAAKSRVLCKILSESENVAQYNAVRYIFIDYPACMRGEQPIPEYVYLQ